MKRFSYIFVFVVLLFGMVLAQTSEPTAWTSWYEYLQFYKTGATTLTNKTLVSPTITGQLSSTDTPDAGANIGPTFRVNLDTAATYTGTTGFKFKVYDVGTGTVHSGGEHAAVYANMKQLSAMTNGGKSVLYSGHNYGSGGNYQVIDAANWMYGNFVDVWKVSGGSIDTGLDLSETTVTGQDIELHNGATINNVHADTVSIDETVVNIGGALTVGTAPTIGITAITQFASASGAERAIITIGGIDYLLVASADSADIVD